MYVVCFMFNKITILIWAHACQRLTFILYHIHTCIAVEYGKSWRNDAIDDYQKPKFQNLEMELERRHARFFWFD